MARTGAPARSRKRYNHEAAFTSTTEAPPSSDIFLASDDGMAASHDGTRRSFMANSDVWSCSSSSWDDLASGITVGGTDRKNSLRDSGTIIGRRETKLVNRLKLVVVMVLTFSMVLVATSTYLYLSRSETNQFHSQFDEDANKVLAAMGYSLDKTFSLMSSMKTSMVTIAEQTNQSWPFVTIPDFAVQMTKIFHLTDATVISLLPVVTAQERIAWEQYSQQHDGWINQGMTIQESWEGYYGPVVYNGTHNSVLHSDFADIPYNESRDFLPLWQNFPVIPNTSSTYNWDWTSFEYPESYIASVENNQIVIGETYMLPDPGDPQAEAETQAWAQFYKNYLSPEEEPVEPMVDLIYPIDTDTTSDTRNSSVVGVLVATLYWRDMIRNILPNGSNGIHLVFDQCNATWTYQIDGSQPRYLGVGDHHDTKYDRYGIHSTSEFEQRDALYDGAPLDVTYCRYMLHVYPSDIMKADYSTSKPLIFTILTVFVFAFTSAVFYTYDFFVERRQQSVVKNAKRSSEIVASLFPSTVRDRLYPTHDQETMKEKFIRNMGEETTRDISTVDNSTSDAGHNQIAELYPDTTILFADIVGFTSWSSSRQPTQVFHLLESLYASFDEIAKRRGVFKVETIGDCYVAAVGLPAPRKSHAVVMARFAQDIRNAATEVFKDLNTTLGSGTADLGLRIGLNSGPTTAGVLRGEKSRFQLFGDTVNTAARMESNGERNRIHISAKTAELLQQADKGHWLTCRDEQVLCKGKGLMTTFWCEPNTSRRSSTASSVSRDSVHSSQRQVTNNFHSYLVDWNVEIFAGILQELSKRRGETVASPGYPIISNHPTTDTSIQIVSQDEAKASVNDDKDTDPVNFQLRTLVSSVERTCRGKSFYSFERKTQSVVAAKRLLDKIQEQFNALSSKQRDQPSKSCDPSVTCGTLADPLIRFAILMAVLVCEMDELRSLSDFKPFDVVPSPREPPESIVDRMMQPQFSALHAVLFPNHADLERFRKVLICVLTSSDTVALNPPVERSASFKSLESSNQRNGTNCEIHLVAAMVSLIVEVSQVTNAMQHFSLFKQWNVRLLDEVMETYDHRRTAENPSLDWYERQLILFDTYLIPLAQKLQDEFSGWGICCDEYMNYVLGNRLEWELNGREIVEEARLNA